MPRRQESWLRSMFDFYATTMRTQIQSQFQYRVATYMYTLGMAAEPTIYLVVWSTIARSQGGTIQGIGPGGFAAYYIVWTLVRTMNVVFTPFGWEERLREGQLSGQLLRPLHLLFDESDGVCSDYLGITARRGFESAVSAASLGVVPIVAR